MKRILLLALAAVLTFSLLPNCSARAEERPVLTIGDVNDRSSARVDGEEQVGLWRYLEDQLGMDIQFVYMTPEDYAAGLLCNAIQHAEAWVNSQIYKIYEDDISVLQEIYKARNEKAHKGQVLERAVSESDDEIPF